MLARRVRSFLLTLVLAWAAGAATVEQRSLFNQGLWWDPSRSGHGVEIFHAGSDAMAVLYTYDESGSPTWCTAQGPVALLGNPWPLMRHEWKGGQYSGATAVGQIWLKWIHFEKFEAVFELHGRTGKWTLEPFRHSGVINEVDLTGLWYDPAQSGWGISMLDQGDAFGAVIFSYEPSGAPTWVYGFDRGKGTRIDLHSARGTCPTCPYQGITTVPAGSVRIDYRGDTEITVRGNPSVPFAPGLALDGRRAFQLGRPASTRRVDFQIAPFATNAALREYIVAGMQNRRVGSIGPAGSDFSAAPPQGAPSFSVTNTQEAGVDEADVFKSDGTFVYSITSATSRSLEQKVRVAYAGQAGSLIQPVGEFVLYQAPPIPYYGFSYADGGMYLHGGNLVTLVSGWYYGGWFMSPPTTADTYVEITSVANPGSPNSRWRARLAGSMVSSRRIGDRVYLVTRFTPNIPGYKPWAYTEADRTANAAILAATPLEAMLPSMSVNGASSAPYVPVSAIHAPQLGGNVPIADMVVVTVIDIPSASVVDSIAIIGRTEALYVSTSNLYLASIRYDPAAYQQPGSGMNLYNTDVHQVRISGDRLAYVGSGSVEGLVGWGDKAAFRFGEHDGRLAVVSSMMNGWWGTNRNRVTILEPSTAAPGLLRTVSFLPNNLRPQPLGKPNEQVYGTRFVGDKLYAVTFRQTDPLYIVDLANKADPRITGELEVPGFSDYLHPMPGGMLLGFGRNATAEGRVQGLQMSLFDVSGAAPKEIQKVLIGESGSDSALFGSHRAVSALPLADGSTKVAFPAVVMRTNPYSSSFAGLLQYEIRGATPATAHIVELPSLVTWSPNNANQYPADEYSWGKGRSVLFPAASIYSRGGSLWRIDSAGNTQGPY